MIRNVCGAVAVVSSLFISSGLFAAPEASINGGGTNGCTYSQIQVAANGAMTATAVCANPNSAAAPTIKIQYASGNLVSSGACTTYGTASVSQNGSMIVSCSDTEPVVVTASTSARFVITPSTTSVVKGQAMDVRVSRLVSAAGTAGTDTATVTVSGASPANSSLAYSFAVGDGKASSKSAQVTFNAAGTATLGLKVNGSDVSGADVAVTVVDPSTTTVCPASSSGVGSTDMGTLNTSNTYNFTSSQDLQPSARATAVFKLTVPAASPAQYVFAFDTLTGGATRGKDVAISKCAGDFSALGVAEADRGKCFVYNTDKNKGIAATVGGADGCPLSANTTYYLNIRARDVGQAMGFRLNISNQ